MTVGPRRTPPITSAMTLGWRIRPNMRESIWVKAMIMTEI
jgi:hypothetical protein